ncbi:MAG: WD40/YVTN/BNR-like repeat-containing protein, partial [Gemmatimonadales bacterium]
QPMIFSRSNPHELLLGFQYLYSTTDGAVNWKRISPDLGAPPAGSAAPVATGRGGGRGGRGGFGSATINAITTSNVAPGVIWVGMSNGTVHVTRDHGATWQETAPLEPARSVAGGGFGRGGGVSAIDASWHDPAAAYVAINRGIGDNAPAFFRTHDYGKTWTKIVNGLPTGQVAGSYSRVIRADTKRAGLLFAGTESGMYVSFDDGDDWQSLRLNLPTTSYRDIVVKNNDLVVATYGRSIWILDDISPLRQLDAGIAAEPFHVFKPGDAIRVRRNINTGTPFPPEMPHGDNPPEGAVIYYNLSAPVHHIAMDVLDAAGAVVRHYSSDPIPAIPEPPPPVPDEWIFVPQPMPTSTGMHRINWDLRYDMPPAFIHYLAHVTGAVPHETHWGGEGPLVIPGTYTLRFNVDGKIYTRIVSVKNDPNSKATSADLAALHALQMKLYQGTRTSWDGFQQIAATRQALAGLLQAGAASDVTQAARSLDTRLEKLAGPTAFMGGRGAPPPLPSFSTINGVEAEEGAVLVSMNGQLKVLDMSDIPPNPSKLVAWRNVCRDLRGVLQQWHDINVKDLPALNALLVSHQEKPIAVASAQLEAPDCATAPARAAGPRAAGGHQVSR